MALGALGFPESELSVRLIGDRGMAELSARFGRPARPTDVLAFSMLEAPRSLPRGPLLGDVVLSVQSAERQARARGVGLDRELRDLLVHGVLHLLGMDHERSSDARAMRELEEHLRWEIRRAG